MINERQIRLRACIVMVLATACFALGQTTTVFGYGAGGDVGLRTSLDGTQVDVGFVILDEFDSHVEFSDWNDSVFNCIVLPRTPTLLPPVPWKYGSPEPGFDAFYGTVPPVKRLTVNSLGLTYWNGMGAPNFAPTSGLTAGDAPQPMLTQAGGGFHAHPVFGIAGASIPDGVYIAKMSVSIETLLDSDPYYMVALIDHRLYTGDSTADSESADMLGDMVNAYLADPVNTPEPVFEGVNYKFYADAIRYAENLAVPEPSAVWCVAIAVSGFIVRRNRLSHDT